MAKLEEIKKVDINLPKVTLIGRTNVGKSTLFNKLIGKRQAIVTAKPGTTRDRNVNIVWWCGTAFQLLDTAGLDVANQTKIDQYEADLVKQVDKAIEMSDLILFVVDINHGILPQDIEVAEKLKQSKKNILLVINKADSLKKEHSQYDFMSLGIDEYQAVSAKNGRGTGDLLDKINTALNNKKADEDVLIKHDFSISLIGKPNVGKSTLINTILNENFCAVSSTPHTTREPQHKIINYNDYNILLTDTAGVRKKYRTAKAIEKISVQKTFEQIETSDICLFLLDASQPIDFQDRALAGVIQDTKFASIIIVANKSDLTKKENITHEEIRKQVRAYFPALEWAPVVIASGKNKKNINNILNLITEAYEARHKRINDNIIDKVLTRIVKKHKKNTKDLPYIYGAKQIGTAPPHFTIISGGKKKLPTGFVRHIAKIFRKKFEFKASPLKFTNRILRNK